MTALLIFPLAAVLRLLICDRLGWVQSEGDRNASTATYKAAFEAMVADYRADIAAITGQPSPVTVITYQPSGQQFDATLGSTVSNKAAQAFFEASETDPDIIIASPTYWLPHTDELHLTATGYQLMGAMVGKVY